MRLILDSTEFCRDFWMNGTSFRVLQELIQRKEMSLIVPEVVLAEVPVIYSEKLREEIGKVRSFNRLLKCKLADSDRDLDALVADYGSFLKTKMAQLGATKQPYATISHKDIVEREMKGIRPFIRTEKIKRGSYRDFLIWLSVIDVVRIASGPVFFISGNTSDFADDSRKSLHKQLLDDLESNGINTNAVSYFESIDEFVKTVALPRMKTVTAPDGTVFRIGVDIEQWVRDAVDSLNIDWRDDILKRFTFQHLNDKYWASIKAVNKVKTVDAKQMDTSHILCEVEVDCRVSIYVGQMDEIGEEHRDAIATMLLTIELSNGSVVANSWDVQPKHKR